MITLQSQAQERIVSAATGNVHDLSLKLYHLTEIVKLAAFAAEARRTLKEIQWVMDYRPDMQEAISNDVRCCNNWAEMPDASADVLANVARQLEAVNDEFNDHLNDLDGGETSPSEGVKTGGSESMDTVNAVGAET